MSAKSYRFVSWNINGIRASIRKNTWPDIQKLNPDIFSVQEIKATDEFMESKDAQKDGYSMEYEFATMKKGYSGVANYLKNTSIPTASASMSLFENKASKNEEGDFEVLQVIKGIGDETFDQEGRMITHLLKHNSSKKKIAYLNGYYPQGGRGPHRVRYKIEFYKKVYELCEQYRQEGYSIILCGDFNTTVGDIDLARPKENRETTGCLPEEREALDWFLKGGYVDTFRHFYPDKKDVYSFWDQITKARERNVGWRIDYYIISDDLIDNVQDAYIWTDIMGSDHCPVGIDIEL
jgi:exodeoxyribonuclease-3